MDTKKIEFYLNCNLIALNLSEVDFNTTVTEFIAQKEYAHTNGDENSSSMLNSEVVLLGEDGGRGALEYRAANATLLLLPMLHGKQIITFSSLVSNKTGKTEAIHPLLNLLQKSAKSHKIEPTAEVILPLFTLYTSSTPTTTEEIRELVPLQDCSPEEYAEFCGAVVEICNQKEEQKQPIFETEKTQIFDQLWRINSHKEHKSWQREDITLYRANSLVDALLLLNKHPEARVVNSTKDNHISTKEPFNTHSSIIEISAVSELEICVEDHSWQLFGAGMKIQELYQFFKKRLPEFADVLSNFGPFLVRNTLAIGSCLSSETTLRKLAPFLMVSHAELLFKTLEKNRIVSLSQFINQPPIQRTEPGELLALLRIPKRKKGELFYAKEYSSQHSSTSVTLSIAACFEVKNSTVEAVEIVFGTPHHAPKYALNCMQILKGNPFTSEQFSKAIATVQADLQTHFSDQNAQNLVVTLAQELLQNCYSEFKKKLSPLSKV